jgi:hypothetical protein
VTCEWLGTAAPYTIGAGITLGPAGDRKFLNFQSRTEPTTAGFRIGDSDWPNEYGGQCSFKPIDVDETTRSVWGEFTCAALSAVEAAEPSPCAIGPSYYFFENCTAPE